jgi:hypothetical protein
LPRDWPDNSVRRQSLGTLKYNDGFLRAGAKEAIHLYRVACPEENSLKPFHCRPELRGLVAEPVASSQYGLHIPAPFSPEGRPEDLFASRPFADLYHIGSADPSKLYEVLEEVRKRTGVITQDTILIASRCRATGTEARVLGASKLEYKVEDTTDVTVSTEVSC